MKRLIIFAAVAISFCLTGTVVLAQEFDGFAMNAPKTQTIDMCHQHGGTWADMPRNEVPDEPSGLTSGGVCTMRQLVGLAPDKSYTLVTAGKVTFVFDYNQRLEFAIFDFGFTSWAERDHARKSVKAHLNEIFPLTASRLNPYRDTEYKLNNLPYFFTLLESEDPVVAGGQSIFVKQWHLALAISRHRITAYETTAGSGIRDEEDDFDGGCLEIDAISEDPLKGL